MTTRPSPEAIRAMASTAGVSVNKHTAARVANAIGPAFDGFATISGTLPFDLEPASYLLAQQVKS